MTRTLSDFGDIQGIDFRNDGTVDFAACKPKLPLSLEFALETWWDAHCLEFDEADAKAARDEAAQDREDMADWKNAQRALGRSKS